MMIFTFLFLILALAGCCLVTRKRSVIPVISCGATAAVLVCAFRTFFLYAHRVIPYSFGENFAFLLIRQAVLPILILYGLFFLLSRDSLEFKADMFLLYDLSALLHSERGRGALFCFQPFCKACDFCRNAFPAELLYKETACGAERA